MTGPAWCARLTTLLAFCLVVTPSVSGEGSPAMGDRRVGERIAPETAKPRSAMAARDELLARIRGARREAARNGPAASDKAYRADSDSGAEAPDAMPSEARPNGNDILSPRQRKFRERTWRARAATDLTARGRTSVPGTGRVEAVVPPAYVAEMVHTEAERTGLPEALVLGLIQVESRFDAGAVSEDGAVGLMQLMPGTAEMLGCVDATEAAGNIAAGTRYLVRMLRRFEGDPSLALAAYNAGPEAVERYGGIPPYPETQAYVADVLAAARAHAALLVAARRPRHAAASRR